ncbi:hypothetical protein HGM15179_000248 [Zosterops borbonicus]|uniref:Uncharacterized protein n=1 Tax=Zosterops borbonicus TaxID=364589 RepID=A0A8K1H0C0_9PASS|nr:hypothetical protein HGM15179_000248 [Zosterops borbonicus]
MLASTALLTLEELCQPSLSEDITIYYLGKEIHLQESPEEVTEATCGNKVLPGVHWQLGEQNQDGKEKGNQPLTLQPACGKSSDDIPELTWQTGLSLMQVQVGPEDLEELVGVISWGLHHHIMVSLDLCWVVLTKPMIVVGHRISSSNSISLSPGPPGTKFCTDLLLQETVPALTGAHLWPTTHPPPIISLIFPSSPKTLLQSKTHLKR